VAAPDRGAHCLDDHYLAALEVAIRRHSEPPLSITARRIAPTEKPGADDTGLTDQSIHGATPATATSSPAHP
jgi:hypothetical protein